MESIACVRFSTRYPQIDIRIDIAKLSDRKLQRKSQVNLWRTARGHERIVQ